MKLGVKFLFNWSRKVTSVIVEKGDTESDALKKKFGEVCRKMLKVCRDHELIICYCYRFKVIIYTVI